MQRPLALISQLCLLFAFTQARADISKPALPSFVVEPEVGAAQDRILVKLKSSGGAKSRAGALRVVQLTAGASVEAAIKAYQTRPDVEYAEPDHVLTPDAVPNDPQWAVQWTLERVRAAAAWDTTPGTKDVTVCVVDSGVDYTHPDIAPNMHELRGFNALDGSDRPMDGLTHGTHVAGILGAAGNNGEGIAGVNWKVKLLACKFMDDKGIGYSSNAIACIQYCVAKGARVIQASWSGGGYNQGVKDAIQAAGDAGVLFVSSSGNKATNLDSTPVYPASYGLPNQIVVGSSGYGDELSDFSNYGKGSVHIVAPGEWVTSTMPGGKYDTMTGTSMATPHVAGAAALLIAAAGGSLKVAEVKALLLDSVTKTEGLAGKVSSGGRLNLEAAVKALVASRAKTDSSASGGSGTPSPAPVPARKILPKSAFCKKNPKKCELKCNSKNVCQYVKKVAAKAASLPAAAMQQQPAQPALQGGARRLLRGGGW